MFAIDSGTNCLKAVRLAEAVASDGRPTAERAELVRCEDGWLGGNFASLDLGDRPALVAALADLGRAVGARGESVALSLPDQFVKVFFLTVDRLQDLTPAERKYTEWRLRELLPGRIAEGCVLDYQVLSTNRSDEGVEIRLIVQLVREEVLNGFASLLLDAEMEPRFVTCDSVATLNLAEAEIRRIREGQEASETCLLHVGNESTSFHFTRLETTEWIRILDYGCRQFRRCLVEDFGLSFDEAERQIAEGELIPGGPPGEAALVETLGRFHGVFEEWFREIGSTFSHYRSHHPCIGPLPVLLCGGGTVLRNLPSFLERLLELPVLLLDPAASCRFPEERSPVEAMRLLPAAGAAFSAREAARVSPMDESEDGASPPVTSATGEGTEAGEGSRP